MRSREEIEQRWSQIDKALRDIAECRVTEGNPAEREGELLEELDQLEYEAGLIEYPQFDDD